ncbi:MAG TPA: hypothetical protein VEX15_24490 [Nocardioidaceae bacterium]|nr:hypothetical protein [Nocardioidaceae bacterium]
MSSFERTIRYRVPDYQDPAAVVGALSRADIRAILERVEDDTYACIECPDGQDGDRERIRMVVALDAEATVSDGSHLERTVVFDDET